MTTPPSASQFSGCTAGVVQQLSSSSALPPIDPRDQYEATGRRRANFGLLHYSVGCCLFQFSPGPTRPCEVRHAAGYPRLRYEDLRELTRSSSLDFSSKRSQVHWTSLAVNGLPPCHLIAGCSVSHGVHSIEDRHARRAVP